MWRSSINQDWTDCFLIHDIKILDDLRETQCYSIFYPEQHCLTFDLKIYSLKNTCMILWYLEKRKKKNNCHWETALCNARCAIQKCLISICLVYFDTSSYTMLLWVDVFVFFCFFLNITNTVFYLSKISFVTVHYCPTVCCPLHGANTFVSWLCSIM